MMQKSNSTKSRWARVLALIPATALALAVVNAPLVSNALERLSETDMSLTHTDKVSEKLSMNDAADTENRYNDIDTTLKNNDEILDECDQLPEFPGGETAMMQFLIENLKFPESEMSRKGRYRVVVQFVVKADGKIGDIEIVQSQGEAFDNEAKRVVSLFPAFTPGMSDGKPVAVRYSLPMVFSTK